ncbi:TnsA endonuclease N-terminal domain-containing protein [Hydrogenophaga sp. SL48]|uniref:TnsA endonuclease N-terminal domain-containing protein n=1 Tax=Hydrogenophaga sp. SL48 TaxID=2806347 RepID=UPI001F1C3724|nr:TnsA endonuclease N-terminal domain-containing protein [Hydrogenophaga sp. SL48]UJW81194.1 Tn7 transposase TnsA N-terminal domain-containing protein [Hydrogenophaga sp. SL48]
MLSDMEQTCFHFITMMAGVEDCREQYPLSVDASVHPLLDYGFGNPLKQYPGTREIAKELGYRHPKTHGAGASCEWIQTTDLLVALNHAHNPKAPSPKSMLAVAVKPTAELSKRARQLLAIERRYWLARGAEWILITPELYVPEVKKTLEEISPWTTKTEPVSHTSQRLAAALAKEHCHRTFRDLLTVLECHFGSEELAKRALWQAVWNGLIPLDLKHGWSPTRPLKLLDPTEFTKLNPVACRRSSWNS